MDISLQMLMHCIQHDASLWGRYLWVLGGLLEYKKTKYCMIIWTFNPDGTPNLLPEEQLPTNNIHIIAADKRTTKIKHFDVMEGRRMLGVKREDI
eukprot:3448428-Ditylum_brightwellii.AAC.1